MAYGPGGVRWRVVRDDSSAWSQRLRARVQTELQASATRVGDAAQEAAPERTGALKESKAVDQESDMEYVVSFGRGLPDARAVYQELGTSHHPAHPYLTPAFQAEIPTLMGRLAQTTQGRVRIDPGGLGGVDADLGGTGGLEVAMGEL